MIKHMEKRHYVYVGECDTCGQRASVPRKTISDAKRAIPAGWHFNGDQHICPYCIKRISQGKEPLK